MRYPIDLVHLWLHESSRVYSDKLMEEKDVELFNKILLDTGKRYFEVSRTSQIPGGVTCELEDQLSKKIFCSFFFFLCVGYRWVYIYQPAIDLLSFRLWCGRATLCTGDWLGEASEDPDGCSWALQWAALWHEPGAVWGSHATHVSLLENNNHTIQVLNCI